MRKHLITGLVILLPLALTILIIGIIVNFLTKPFFGIVSHLIQKTEIANRGFLIFSPEQTIYYTSQIIIIVCIFLVILLLGMVARWMIVRWVIQISDKLLVQLPFVNKVYRITKDIITTLLDQNKNKFEHVVMIPFPSPGTYAIGFISREAPVTCKEASGENLFSVFLPTAPNPTTGFVMMFKKCDIIYTDMKIDEAIKYIVSCGMVVSKNEEQ